MYVLKTAVFFCLLISIQVSAQEFAPDSLKQKAVFRAIGLARIDAMLAIKKKASVSLIKSARLIEQLDSLIFIMLDSSRLLNETNERTKTENIPIKPKCVLAFLDGIEVGVLTGELEPKNIPDLINSFLSAFKRYNSNISILPIIRTVDPASGRIILNSIPSADITGLNESKDYVVINAFKINPRFFFSVLFDFPDVPSADSLLIVSARIFPQYLYTYSQAKNTVLGSKIQNCNNKLVKLISNIADLPDGRFYFPFLDELCSKAITFSDIAKTLGTNKRTLYYKLLVKTKINYTERMLRGDTAIGLPVLQDKLTSVATDDFINSINGLHEYPDNIRMKKFVVLNAQELYYICIAGVNDLYTSSFLKIYNLIVSRSGFNNSYAFLKSLYFDHFKRFMKMTSTFNTLDDFLKRMKRQEADTLLHSFVNGLSTAVSLEDAVDVADSYANIKNDSLRRFILKEVQLKDASLKKDNAVSANTIYELLDTLFLSLDKSNHINLSSVFGIPSVYQITNSYLKDDAGRIVVQHYFYGDKDGRNAFNVFIKSFQNPLWKITFKKYWVECISRKGTPIIMYANMPLDNNTNQDEDAQNKLASYLKDHHLNSSIMVHRGHSYFVNNTLKQLSPYNKLVFLGSCGGYTSLSQVFSISPFAHLITTKQEGSGLINQPMIDYLIELLRKGYDLDWPAIWKNFGIRFKNDLRFKDYMPPHQNLGAILIMAYYTRYGKAG